MIRRLILVLLTLSCVAVDSFLNAQNLVPNGNFEEEKDGAVLYWQQPVGLYYHYEKRWVKRERMKLDAINGICFVSPFATEYLQVKLKEPLKAGETYKLQLEIMRSAKEKVWSDKTPDWIEVYFSDTLYDVLQRTLIVGQSQIQFDASRIKQGDMFYTFAKPYTARGNEKYLIIGRFVNPINDNIYRTYHYYNEGKRKALETARIVHSHQLLYTPVSDWGVSKNKQYRMYKKRRRIWDKWYNQQVDSINKVFAPILDTIPKPSRYESYDTRYYFDNISLIRTSSDEPVDEVSEPVITNTEPEVKTDITYTLQHVVFDTDKSELKPESVEELNYIIELMQRYTDYNIHLTGHTDSINNEAYNLKLSSDRAKACALYLTQNGIDKSRVTYEGKGESQPVAPNSTEEGRQMNRRVEFVFRRK